MCADGAGADAGRRRVRGRRRSRRGAPGETPRWRCRRGAPARRRHRRGRAPVRRGVAGRGAIGQHRHGRRSARPSSRCWPWIAGDWDRGGRTRSTLALATIDEHRLHDYVDQRARLRRRPRASPCTGATWRTRSGSWRGRCGPGPSCTVALPWLAVRRAPATGQGVRRARRHDAPLGTCCARSTTSCRHRPEPGHAGRRGVASSGRASPPRCSAGAAGGPPLSPAELRLLPYLQTHLTLPRDRRVACSSPTTPCGRRSARSTASWACRRAATRWSTPRRSACSAA